MDGGVEWLVNQHHIVSSISQNSNGNQQAAQGGTTAGL